MIVGLAVAFQAGSINRAALRACNLGTGFGRRAHMLVEAPLIARVAHRIFTNDYRLAEPGVRLVAS